VAAVTPLLRTLPQDFASIAFAFKHGGGHNSASPALQPAAAMAHCGRVLRVARFLLLRGIFVEELLGPLEGRLPLLGRSGVELSPMVAHKAVSMVDRVAVCGGSLSAAHGPGQGPRAQVCMRPELA